MNCSQKSFIVQIAHAYEFYFAEWATQTMNPMTSQFLVQL